MRPHSPFAAPPLTSPSGAPQRQLSFTGTDSTLDCPRVKLGLVVSVLLVDCETVPTETHNATLSPASRALERDHSVRGYPTHVPDPLSSFGHAAWRFLKVAPAGRYAALDLSDRIGADSCPCAFHWLQHLLGQPRLSENFSRGASRGPLRVRRRAELQASFSRPHRACATATPMRLCSPGYGLSSAPSRGSRTRDGAELAGCKAPTAAALSPLFGHLTPSRGGHLRGKLVSPWA